MDHNNNFDWRKIVFAIAIALLFIPMVFLGVNTFFPKEPANTCYNNMFPVAPKEGPLTQEEQAQYNADQQKYNEEQQVCQTAWDAARIQYDGMKYIVIMIICIIASFTMLLNLDKSIIYGLFFGVVITAFSGTIAYIQARSIVGFILMVVLFILIIVWVQRERQKVY
jgi:hypothetical protein